MAIKLKKGPKYILLAVLFVGIFFAVKHFVLDAPKAVDTAQTLAKNELTLATEATAQPSLSTSDKLKLPEFNSPTGKGTKVKWQVMAWNSQFPLMYANGGPRTSAGSLFEKGGIDVTIVRQDDCFKTIADFIANANELKSNPEGEPIIMSFMGDGVPGFSVMMKELEKLGPEYAPIVFYHMGRSDGEDGFWGPQEWKANPSAAKGKTVAGVEKDGDLSIVIKWAADNNIPINAQTKYFDSSALNIIPASTFIEAGEKYITGYTETRLRIKDGKTTNESVTVGTDSYTSWTPVDVTVATKKGGLVRLASTKEYTSQMPNASIILKSWAYAHRTEMENIIAALGQAGDQVRSFPEATAFAAKVSAAVYGDEPAEFWLKYYKGVEQKDATGMRVQLGGSKAFNLTDAANMVGLGDDKKDRYKVTYEVFGNALKKLYPKDMEGFTPYNKIMDKSFLLSVISNHPELLKGKAITQDYNESITSEVSNKSVQIEFGNNSDVISPSSYKEIDEIYNSAVIAEGLKLGIYGHTNAVGSDETNRPLSERRAAAVARYLQKKGISASQIEVKGYGSDSPIEGIDPKDSRNRRVEIVLGQ